MRDARDVPGVVHRDEIRHLSDDGFTVTAGGANGARKPAAPAMATA